MVLMKIQNHAESFLLKKEYPLFYKRMRAYGVIFET